MPSPVTASDFANQSPSDNLCDAFQKKLLNNARMNELLDYLFDDNGEFTEPFFNDLLLTCDPIGKIILAPRGIDIPATGPVYLECNGVKVKQADYPKLYAFLGTAYNDGTQANDEFMLPNLSDRFPIGRSPTKLVGAKGGDATVVLTEAQLPAHSHLLLTNEIAANTGDPRVGDGVARSASATDSGNDYEYRMQRGTVEAELGKSSETGAGEAHPNIPPYVALAFYMLAGYKLRGTML